MVASLGLFLVIENVIALMFGDQALRFPIARARAVRITIAMLTPTQIGAMIAVATFTALSAAVLKTRMGVGLRAVAADAELATTSGIDRKKIDMVATVMATLPAAVAGILWAYDNDLNITMGFRLLLFGLTASVVGGSRWGTSALVGGLTVGVVQYTSIWRIGTEWQDSIVFGLLVIGLIFKPDGLLGTALPRRTG
jgi:branched-chain amino acid transport system permease protein